MDLTKKKYSKAEVIEIVNACKTEYEHVLIEQKDRISDLVTENSQLKVQVEKLNAKSELINSTLIRAEKNARKLKEKAQLQYAMEIERLRTFSVRWEDYFQRLKEKYPLYGAIDQAIDVKQRLASVLKLSDAKKAIDKLEKTFDEKGLPVVHDRENAQNYVAATNYNGFNLDEVLNPGELELEDICKELGLLDGDE